MLPERLAPLIFGVIVSGVMSCIITGVATLRAIGPSEEYVEVWLGAWGFSFMVAFPLLLVVAPAARKLVALLTTPRS